MLADPVICLQQSTSWSTALNTRCHCDVKCYVCSGKYDCTAELTGAGSRSEFYMKQKF